jgi:glycosyltransferase involved in cell wall biosynthesis
MRILQLGPYPPPHGGVQSNLVAIHRYLVQRGISSKIINITRFRTSNDPNVYHPRNWLHLLALLARTRCDVVHLHIGGTVTPRLLALSILLCAMPRRKAVLTFHSGGYPSSREGRKARPLSLRGFIFRRFDRIIGVNPDIVLLFHRFGVKRENVSLIYPHALPSTVSDGPLPPPLGGFFAAHAPVLLTVGLLEPEYDLIRQIEILGSVRGRYPKAGLVIIGAGSLEVELSQTIQRTSYAGDVLLCGDVSHDDTLLAMRDCDLVLRTTVYDGDSISVREALHLGVPVIATDTGMRPEGVRLVPLQDSGAVVREIEDVLAHPSHRQPVQGSSEDNLHAVLELYEGLMAELNGR